MYSQRHAAYDAKNRVGLTEEIEMGTSCREAFANFLQALKDGKKGGVK